MNIGKFSVRNPVLINIIMVVVFVLGIVATNQLPQENFPEIPFYFIAITVPYTGIAAEDIEQNVVIKIEEKMQGLKKLKEVRSIVVDGMSLTTLEFSEGISRVEFENVLQEVRARYGNIDLPDDVGEETIDDFSSTDLIPVIHTIISGNVPYPILEQHAKRLSIAIRRIKDVSDVTTIGEREKEIVVEVDRERSESYGISLPEISLAIQNSNIAIPGGVLKSGNKSFFVRTDRTLKYPEQLESIAIRSTNQGTTYVSNIATIKEVYDEDGIISRFNGKPSIALSVTKVPSGDSAQIVKDIKATVNTYQDNLGEAGVSVNYLSDSSIDIARNIRVLGTNIIFGFFLVIGVLALFLGIRNAMLTAIGIPISFGATMTILYISGATLNSNALFALVLVLGLIVDHAIVIVENCHRLNASGETRHNAAIKGVNQVITPVVAASATTIAAFLPLTFLPGIIGRFLSIVPIVVSIALVASTLEALFIIPSHYADWGRRRSVVRKKRFFDAFQAKFDASIARFGKFIALVYRHRLITVGIFMVLIAASLFLFSTIDQELFASDEFSYFYIDIKMPVSTTIEKTEQVVAQFETTLLPLLARDEIIAINSSIGFAFGRDGNQVGSDIAQLIVDLPGVDEGRERTLDEIIAEFRTRTADIVGPEQVRFRKQEAGPPVDAPIVYQLYGDSFDDLEAVSNNIQGKLADFPQLFEIRDDLNEGSPELTIHVNESEASRYGVTVAEIGAFINTIFEGAPSGVIFNDNEETKIRVKYDQISIQKPEQILLLKIPNSRGELIPLSTLIFIETSNSINVINRVDQKRAVTVKADSANQENLFIIDNAINTHYLNDLLPRYPDVELVAGGQFDEFQGLFFDILIVMSVGIFLIYVILGAQFRSYLQPFLILLTVPFALFGVVVYLLISNTAISIIVIYAAVALAGIAVNDSIVLISFVNDARREGKSVHEAILTAVRLRLRPIILTSLTTIFGLLPTALGLGGKSVVWIPMANTIIFGLIFSTITTLIIVPCLYGLLFDRKRKASAH